MNRVVVVGGGPVGMVAGLALHRHGFPVTVYEREPVPVKDQRAASIHPPTLMMLAKLGVADLIVPRGLKSYSYQYRDRVSGDLIAEFDLRDLGDLFDFPYVLQYEQYKLTRDIAAVFADQSDFDVRYGTEVIGLTQSEDYVEVSVRGPGGEERIRTPFVIGADGGRSTVRKAAGIEFKGFTYDEKFVKIATRFDFQVPYPDYAFRNYFSDPSEWCNLFKVKGDDDTGLWRAIFPTLQGEGESLTPEAVEARMQRFFPKEGQYNVAYAATYSVSQRVAEVFRKNRILLAGDSAHVNNPIGGMGMNGGIHDAVNLAEKVATVLRGEADASLLDLYSLQRRHAAVKYVQAQTIGNKQMLEEKDEAARRKKFDEMRRTAADPASARAFMRRASLLESLETANSVNA